MKQVTEAPAEVTPIIDDFPTLLIPKWECDYCAQYLDSEDETCPCCNARVRWDKIDREKAERIMSTAPRMRNY